jgi:hypothetical protein
VVIARPPRAGMVGRAEIAALPQPTSPMRVRSVLSLEANFGTRIELLSYREGSSTDVVCYSPSIQRRMSLPGKPGCEDNLTGRARRSIRRRYVVERTLAWLSKCSGLLVRNERKSEKYLAQPRFSWASLWPMQRPLSRNNSRNNRMMLLLFVLR